MDKLQYFGTDLDRAGHFWREVERDRLGWKAFDHRTLPFNPDTLMEKATYRGSTGYFQIGEYSIIAIASSCYDTRPGCCSVFFIKEDLTAQQLYDLIMSTEITAKIVNKIPYELRWFDIL